MNESCSRISAISASSFVESSETTFDMIPVLQTTRTLRKCVYIRLRDGLNVMHMLQTSKNVEMDQKLCRQVVNVKRFMEPFTFPQEFIRLIHTKVHQAFGKIRVTTMSSYIVDANIHQQPDNSNTGATAIPDLILRRCISSYDSINYSCLTWIAQFHVQYNHSIKRRKAVSNAASE